MKFKKVAPAVHLSSPTPVTYRDIYGGVHTSQARRMHGPPESDPWNELLPVGGQWH